jgi:hypothetical protein
MIDAVVGLDGLPLNIAVAIEATRNVDNNSATATIQQASVATKGETTMADIVTGTTTGQLDTTALMQDHADIRRENAQSEAQVRRDIQSTSGDSRREAAEIGAASAYQNATQHAGIVDQVKSAGWANSDRTGTEADRVVGQGTAYFIAEQQYAFNNATAVAALKAGTDMQFANTLSAINSAAQMGQAATALEGAKSAAAAALGQALIGQQIVADGNNTRALINELKMEQLNRELIERNAALVEARGDCRYWQGGYNQSQFAAVTSQLQAFQSQLSETRQGMVNFGTQSGVGQTATTNSVR